MSVKKAFYAAYLGLSLLTLAGGIGHSAHAADLGGTQFAHVGVEDKEQMGITGNFGTGVMVKNAGGVLSQLQDNDIIVSINGGDVDTGDEVNNHIDQATKDHESSIDVQVWRVDDKQSGSGSLQDVNIGLPSAPQRAHTQAHAAHAYDPTAHFFQQEIMEGHASKDNIEEYKAHMQGPEAEARWLAVHPRSLNFDIGSYNASLHRPPPAWAVDPHIQARFMADRKAMLDHALEYNHHPELMRQSSKPAPSETPPDTETDLGEYYRTHPSPSVLKAERQAAAANAPRGEAPQGFYYDATGQLQPEPGNPAFAPLGHSDVPPHGPGASAAQNQFYQQWLTQHVAEARGGAGFVFNDPNGHIRAMTEGEQQAFK
jgi:hypothetical protein